MSPMNISRTPYSLRDCDRDPAASPFVDLRNGNPQLAVHERGARARRIARATEADDAREAAVAALDEMKRRIASGAAWSLFSGDQQGIAFGEDVHGLRRDAREIGHDFERIVGLVDVDLR